MHNKAFVKSILISACITALACSSASADDTEVFFGQVDSSVNIFPNVMFVLDTSGSMNYKDDTSQTRLDRMKDALDEILDNATNVNVGLMRFNGSSGGGAVLFPVTPIDEKICTNGACDDVHISRRIKDSWSDAEQEKNDDQEMDGNDNVLNLGKSSSRGSEVVGLHYTEVSIPQGATITKAMIEFTSNKQTNQQTSLKIRGEMARDSAPFSDEDDDDAFSERDKTSPVTWIPGEWMEGLRYESEDISSVVQDIVNQENWCGGNSLALFIDGNGNRDARSYDKTPGDAPILNISYDPTTIPATGGCAKKVELAQITRGSDDVMEYSWGQMARFNSNISIPKTSWGGTTQAGFRFTGIDIPKNAVITDARLMFEIDNQQSGGVKYNVYGENRDNPGTFKSWYNNVSNRSKTSAVVWENVAAPATNDILESPNLSSIVQSLVNRRGWSSGNAMAFILKKESGNGYRLIETFEGEQPAAAKLRIEYESQIDASNAATYLTARDLLKESVNELTATGGTPIVDAYYEASQYMRGKNVDYGKRRGYYPNRYHRVSVPESYTGGSVSRSNSCTDSNLDHWNCYSEKVNGSPVYNSPMESSCQTNHIVFLSDGEATSNSAYGKVQSLTGESCSGSGSQTCGVELAQWLNENDHSDDFDGKQNITTYTIGFNFTGTFLPALAANGGGTYSEASSSAQLVAVFRNILGDVLSVDTSFVAPGATVNQFNRLTHRNDIYFALFKPRTQATWDGNLKRYQIGEYNGKATIMDHSSQVPNADGSASGNKPAVDEATGFFAADAVSYWDSIVDGNTVALGGAAGQMDFGQTPRRIFTHIGSNDFSGQISLTANANKVNETNSAITQSHLGIGDSAGSSGDRTALRIKLLKWARGIDVKDENANSSFTDSRKHMGDPMHARPVVLNYSVGSDVATSVFLGTNEGYLHSIDAATGAENYSFVPQELLPNLYDFYRNTSALGHPYGLDGSLSVWAGDVNENVMIDSGEMAYLYTGMRRGGSNYYAFNVSSRLNPKLAWVIEGGADGDSKFKELGQSWSKAIPTTIWINGEKKKVLIFGGGYDTNQDPSNTGATVHQSEDTIGRAIFIVDAQTGERLWAIGGDKFQGVDANQEMADMDYSIPGDLRVLDVNNDGLADQMYAGDMGGQIWRFDFTERHDSSTTDLVTGGVIANLSGTAQKDQRRFYYEPDVAIIATKGRQFLSIGIGSGWRAHPLDVAVHDRFYLLKSNHVYSAPDGYGKKSATGTYSPVTESDLVSVTDTINDPGESEHGWFIDMPGTGEKILGDSLTVNNQVVFTSYKPAANVAACTTAIGSGSAYVLSVLDGSPTSDLDGDGDITDEDASIDLNHGGIPPEPAALITEFGNIVQVGPTQIPVDFENLTFRTYWRDATADLDPADVNQ